MTARPTLAGVAVLGVAALLALSACDNDDTAPTDDAASSPSAAESSAPSEEPPTSEPGIAPDSTEAGIARAEDFLHAVGDEDIDAVCEIVAIPASEMSGMECEEAFPYTFQMISPEQSDALKTATVDPEKVEETGAGQIHVPVDAMVADATFGEDTLGDLDLEFQEDDWYIVA